MQSGILCDDAALCVHSLIARIHVGVSSFSDGLKGLRELYVFWCHHAQMSAWQGSAVPCLLLHTGHRCCWQAASQVGHTANDGGATISAIYCWPPSIHCATLRGLELLAGRPPHTAGL